MSEQRGWIVFAGLPGSGKSTLARRLARELGLLHLDKDRIRETLFGPDLVQYSREQDDHCMWVLYGSAHHALETGLVPRVVIDGRTYTRAEAVHDLVRAARHTPLTVVECRCRLETARARVLEQSAHRAGNRDPGLVERLAREAVDLGEELASVGGPRPLELDTERDLELCVADLLGRLA